MSYRSMLSLLLLMIGLVLVGYVWPSVTDTQEAIAERDWQWPDSQISKETEPQPKLLARFWPVKIKTLAAVIDDEAAKAAAHSQRTLKLVAIVRQGNEQQALVLNPEGELRTLSAGDLLDEQRQVITITHSGLNWQRINNDNSQQDANAEPELETEPEKGELTLFPKPPAI